MHYTRAGLSLPETSFLGRWKSSAVFRYVEEALQELPANWRSTPVQRGPEEDVGQGGSQVRGRKRKVASQGEETTNAGAEKTTYAPGPLWAVSRSRNGKTTHLVSQAAWNLPLREWQTACGWHFARLNTKVVLTRSNPGDHTHCKKCREITELRDEVKGGFSLAQLVEL